MGLPAAGRVFEAGDCHRTRPRVQTGAGHGWGAAAARLKGTLARVSSNRGHYRPHPLPWRAAPVPLTATNGKRPAFCAAVYGCVPSLVTI